jgi:protocatechuate 3,4-dioxygenase beta subunit
MRAVASLLGALALAGCAPGSNDPIVFSGTLEDQLGQPVPRAEVILEAYDSTAVPAGAEPPVVFTAETTTDANGQFEFRFFPPDVLVRAAAPNGGLVPFSATAHLPDRNTVWVFDLVREISLDGWADTATPIRWRPSP